MFVKLERELTKDDVGKKVKLRKGSICTLETRSYGNPDYPFSVRYDKGVYSVTYKGAFWHDSTQLDPDDIVEIEEIQLSKGPPPGHDIDYTYINLSEVPIPSYKTSPTIQINIQNGMTVIKGRFLDSSGESWYVTLDKV